MERLAKFLVLLASCFTVCSGKNIVLILADDLDSVLDGMIPLKSTRKLIGDEGITYDNAFAAVPICCPNRASILTGRYQHNHGTFNNSLEGGCNSIEWQQKHEPNTFAAILKKQMNYTTFYAGKYLNQYGAKKAGGPARVPAGWDKWYGLVGNSKYYNYSLSANGVEKRYGAKPEDYLTDVIKNFGVDFIKQQKGRNQPFLMMLAPPAPHEPWYPAPRHSGHFHGTVAKRTKSFNTASQSDKHWLVRMGLSPLPPNMITVLDESFSMRWETLLAVDELVKAVYDQLNTSGLLNNTYIIFASDNGYHMGQFSMPYDKRQPYDTDIRVPLLIRGPGLAPGKINAAVSSVDLFATIMEIAGAERPSDGMSLLNYNDKVDDRHVLIEYRGEKSEVKPQTGCPTDEDLNLSHCHKDFACKCQDAANNTFSCVRRVSEHYNNVFCKFDDTEKFVEYYDLLTDESQMKNIGGTMGRNHRNKFRRRLDKLETCKGINCILTGTKRKKHST
ncbi:hypothetical protein QAD02_004020 [Eretmocerus hayati]|uniref:Uncharacterized protein n=1 Tax=Eretmocerus hayati TaxID=131215 RepID=A0ACC2NNC3_9HYME|nr:hypothetical protein QAD02_004020 [Eretmocerus hayati]